MITQTTITEHSHMQTGNHPPPQWFRLHTLLVEIFCVDAEHFYTNYSPDPALSLAYGRWRVVEF